MQTLCPGGGDQIINCAPQSTYGVVVIENVTLCLAGETEIIYDIGFMNNGAFVLFAENVLQSDVSVVPGLPVGFRLDLQDSVAERSYSRILSKIVIVFQDQGRNVSMLHFVFDYISHNCIFAEGCRLYINQSLSCRGQSRNHCTRQEHVSFISTATFVCNRHKVG